MLVKLNKKLSLRFLILLMIAIVLPVVVISNSDLFCRAQPTKLAALRDFPGKLGSLSEKDIQTVQVLQQTMVADGVSILYYWKQSGEITSNLAVTFLTPYCNGWRAQSTGFIENDKVLYLSDVISEDTPFTPAYYTGGNVRPLTTFYGISGKGAQVRVIWSDDLISYVAIQKGSFLQVRMTNVQVRQVDLLDREGNIIASENLEYK